MNDDEVETVENGDANDDGDVEFSRIFDIRIFISLKCCNWM